jgi:hypothetical protein
MKNKVTKKLKKEKKKLREKGAELRRRQQLGIEDNAFDVSEDLDLFTLPKNLNHDEIGEDDEGMDDDSGTADDDDLIDDDESDDDEQKGSSDPVKDLESQLELDYQRYLNRRKSNAGDDNEVNRLITTLESQTREGRRQLKKQRLDPNPNLNPKLRAGIESELLDPNDENHKSSTMNAAIKGV